VLEYHKARGGELRPPADSFMGAVEVPKENKQRYEAAQAQALMQPKSPMAGFMRSFVNSQAIKAGGEDK
jgi:hypothetical protein